MLRRRLTLLLGVLTAAAACDNEYDSLTLADASGGSGHGADGPSSVGQGGGTAGATSGPGGGSTQSGGSSAGGAAGAGGAPPCAPGFGDCSGSDGICETDLTTDTDCGLCGFACATWLAPGFACSGSVADAFCSCSAAACDGFCDRVTGLCACLCDGTCQYGETCIDSGAVCACGGGESCPSGFVCLQSACYCDGLDSMWNYDAGAADCNGGTCNSNLRCVCGGTECDAGKKCTEGDASVCQ